MPRASSRTPIATTPAGRTKIHPRRPTIGRAERREVEIAARVEDGAGDVEGVGLRVPRLGEDGPDHRHLDGAIELIEREREVQASISAKRVSIPLDEARELAKRALQFKTEKGRLPDINSQDAWEKRMAEGVAALARFRADEKAREADRLG